MKNHIAILAILMINSCSNHKENQYESSSDKVEVHEQKHNNEWNYEPAKINQINQYLTDACSSKNLEFTDLYPILDSIASDPYERLILVQFLKAKEFKVTNWGRGNWQEGPRIVSFTLSNQQCDCQVDKLYYSTKIENKYRVTERIKCTEAGESIPSKEN